MGKLSVMSAAKEKIFPGKIAAWLAVLFILLAALAAPVASVIPVCRGRTSQNRAGENSVAAVLLRLTQSSQTPDLQWENSIGRYDLALDDTLSAEREGIVAQNGTRVTGFTTHGVDRAIGDAAQRAGTKPQAILDALKNPKSIETGVDPQGRPYQKFIGGNATVIVNPQSGRVVTVWPTSAAGSQ